MNNTVKLKWLIYLFFISCLQHLVDALMRERLFKDRYDFLWKMETGYKSIQYAVTDLTTWQQFQ